MVTVARFEAVLGAQTRDFGQAKDPVALEDGQRKELGSQSAAPVSIPQLTPTALSRKVVVRCSKRLRAEAQEVNGRTQRKVLRCR
jgi:hypothetical protein